MTFSASSDLRNIGRDDAPAWTRNSSMDKYCRMWIACMPSHFFLWSDDVFDVFSAIPWRKGGSARCQMAACGLSFAVNSIGNHHNYRPILKLFARRSICRCILTRAGRLLGLKLRLYIWHPRHYLMASSTCQLPMHDSNIDRRFANFLDKSSSYSWWSSRIEVIRRASRPWGRLAENGIRITKLFSNCLIDCWDSRVLFRITMRGINYQIHNDGHQARRFSDVAIRIDDSIQRTGLPFNWWYNRLQSKINQIYLVHS
jgi:hypothetical protein